MQESIAASIHRSAMVQRIGRRPEKQRDAALSALRLVATDIAAANGYDQAEFARLCGLS